MEKDAPLNKEHIDLKVEELASLETTTQSSGPKLEAPSEKNEEKKLNQNKKQYWIQIKKRPLMDGLQKTKVTFFIVYIV